MYWIQTLKRSMYAALVHNEGLTMTPQGRNMSPI